MHKRGATINNAEAFKKTRVEEENIPIKEERVFLDELKSSSPRATAWGRKTAPSLNCNTQSLAFQWVDVNVHCPEPESPIIRLYGVTAEGFSVLLHVHDFVQYFYVDCPPNFKEKDCKIVQHHLENRLSKVNGTGSHIQGVELRKRSKTSLFGAKADPNESFLVVYVKERQLMEQTRSMFRDGIAIPGYRSQKYETYTNSMSTELQFMVDHDISGCSWLELPSRGYTLRSEETKISTCQYEADISHTKIISHAPKGRKWGKVAPLRVLCFDIETFVRGNIFSDPNVDSVLLISNIVREQGSDQPLTRNVFCLGTCNPIEGAEILEFETECEMLEKWIEFVQEADPDIITGYNIDQFDLPYIRTRLRKLEASVSYPQCGRLRNTDGYPRMIIPRFVFPLDGRVSFDLLPIMRTNYDLNSYKLDNVSGVFLGQHKGGVKFYEIADLHRGSDADRHRLALYCLKDSYLTIQLSSKLTIISNYIEMARVTGIPLTLVVDAVQRLQLVKAKNASVSL